MTNIIEIAKSVSEIIALIGIPLVIFFVGNAFSRSIKEREIQSRFVELAVNILREVDPKLITIREWAIKVINNYSGVPLGNAERDIKENKLPISKLSGSAFTTYEVNMEIEYKGYVIEARPNKRKDNEKWTTSINIIAFNENEMNIKQYYSRDIFDTKEEAIDKCFSFGKKIIDGEVEGLFPPKRD